MRGLRRLFTCLALTLLSWLLSACAQQESDPDRISTIPWNRPEKWEGQGPLGSMGMNSQ